MKAYELARRWRVSTPERLALAVEQRERDRFMTPVERERVSGELPLTGDEAAWDRRLTWTRAD